MQQEKTNHCVYKLISPKNHVYVGITKNLVNRLYQHSRLSQNRYFGEHCDKNGFDFEDFDIEVYREGLTKKVANKIERQQIAKYQKENRCLNYAKRTDFGKSFEVKKPNGEKVIISTHTQNQ